MNLSVVEKREFYLQGEKVSLTFAGTEKILIEERCLFLPSSFLFAVPELSFQPNIAFVAETPHGSYSKEILGNQIWGSLRGKKFFDRELYVDAAIFHKPHFLPKLYWALLKEGIVYLRATLPESSPYRAYFPSVLNRHRVPCAVSKKAQGVHFFAPKGSDEK